MLNTEEQGFYCLENSWPLQIVNTAEKTCSTDESKAGTGKYLLRLHKTLRWCPGVPFCQEQKKISSKNFESMPHRSFNSSDRGAKKLKDNTH